MVKLGMTIAALAVGAASLTGCDTSGQLTPAATAAINTAYNDVCSALPALGPVSATMNADAKNAYAQAQTICAAGAPSNAIAAKMKRICTPSARSAKIPKMP